MICPDCGEQRAALRGISAGAGREAILNFHKTVQICGVSATCVLRIVKTQSLPYLYRPCVIMAMPEEI